MTETRTRRTLLALLVATFLVAAGIGGGVATVATLSDTETVSITASADVRPQGPPEASQGQPVRLQSVAETETSTPMETETPAETPAETGTPTPTVTETETPMPTPMETETPTETSTESQDQETK